eukprot:6938006-Prymnesium_polylepis.3
MGHYDTHTHTHTHTRAHTNARRGRERTRQTGRRESEPKISGAVRSGARRPGRRSRGAPSLNPSMHITPDFRRALLPHPLSLSGTVEWVIPSPRPILPIPQLASVRS